MIVLEDDSIGQLNAQNFSGTAYKNPHAKTIQQPRLEAENAKRLPPDGQVNAAGFPMQHWRRRRFIALNGGYGWQPQCGQQTESCRSRQLRDQGLRILQFPEMENPGELTPTIVRVES